jgi:hypothetical protein
LIDALLDFADGSGRPVSRDRRCDTCEVPKNLGWLRTEPRQRVRPFSTNIADHRRDIVELVRRGDQSDVDFDRG